MKRTRTKQRCIESQGFTRSDLVVCMAALIVLGALGASALSSSKGNSSQMVCANNLRQMGLAEGMYASDNRDYLAFCNWDGGDTDDPSGYSGWLYTLPVPQGLPDAGSSSIPNPFVVPFTTTSMQGAWLSGVWFQYVSNYQSYLCPVDIQSRDYALNPSQGGRTEKLSSYVMNGAPCSFGGGPSTCKVSDVWSPACYLMWTPNENTEGVGDPGAFEFNDGANFPEAPPGGAEALSLLHCNNGDEMLTVGGNVNFVTEASFKSMSLNLGAGPGGKGLLWWAPSIANGGFGE